MRRIALIGFACFAPSLLSCGGANKNAGFNAPAVTTAGSQSGGALGPIAGSANDAQKKPDQIGLATWYGQSFAGKKTASGEKFDPGAMTAAHRKLPFNTWVEVRRVDTGGVVRVRITDRGPWGDDRKVIDLSHAAADKLGIVPIGVVKVELRVVSGPE